MQINTNGYLVIGPDENVHDLSIKGPFPSINQVAAIAPFNSDINVSGYSPGFLSYRLDTTPAVLARATDAVMAIGQYAQELPHFHATWTLVVTWHDAAFYSRVEVNQTEVSSLFTRRWKLDNILYISKIVLRSVIIVYLQ